MNDVIVKDQIVKLIKNLGSTGLKIAVIAWIFMLLGASATILNAGEGVVILLILIGYALFGLTIGLWTAEGYLKKTSIFMGLWADKKELRKAIKEK